MICPICGIEKTTHMAKKKYVCKTASKYNCTGGACKLFVPCDDELPRACPYTGKMVEWKEQKDKKCKK